MRAVNWGCGGGVDENILLTLVAYALLINTLSLLFIGTVSIGDISLSLPRECMSGNYYIMGVAVVRISIQSIIREYWVK